EKLLKLRNILGYTAGGYDILAKSISYAGAESAATEAQIIAVANEIAPYARQVGFATEETIGFATALASLQIAPERARSATQ
ncbi:phage tail tape measure protein, partial [Salmonella enterica subsp. enterica serovar Anatum]